VTQVVENLPTKCEALSSNSSTTKKKKKSKVDDMYLLSEEINISYLNCM
jgi:hypothetical protein